MFIAVGALLRFSFQFLSPSFSGDEINLGNNIKHRGFLELLAPLDNYQSAPPMFLWLQKAVVSVVPIDFWVSIKLVSFAVSVLILFEAARLSRKLFENLFAQILFVAFFVFSPSILYHTLAVKQYGFDILFLLFALNNFPRLRTGYFATPFFAVWCLLSNIGPFFAAALIAYRVMSHIRHFGIGTIHKFAFEPKNILLALSPLPYVAYFFWYMKQPGAAQIKEYMLSYWAYAFMPLDASVFQWLAYLFDEVAFYFITPSRALSYALFVVAVIGIFPMLTRQGDEKRRMVMFLLLGALAHAVMSAMKMFPVSERLYLYESPLMYIFLISGVMLICRKFAKPALIALAVLLATLNIANIPFKQNDIVSMLRYMEREKISDVAYSERAYNDVRSFNEFTDSAFGSNDLVELYESAEFEADDSEIRNPQSAIRNFRYIVSRSHVEFRHHPTDVEEEDQILWMLRAGKLELVHQTQGYKLYRLK